MGSVKRPETDTEKDLYVLRLRCRSAFEACKALVVKPADQLTDRELRVLEAFEAAHDALLAAFEPNWPGEK